MLYWLTAVSHRDYISFNSSIAKLVGKLKTRIEQDVMEMCLANDEMTATKENKKNGKHKQKKRIKKLCGKVHRAHQKARNSYDTFGWLAGGDVVSFLSIAL